MRINILLCDTFPGLLPDYIPSYVSMFTRLFDSVAEGIEYKVYNTMEGELPVPRDNNELYLITGCNQSAYDDTPWIKRLLDWIRRADEAQAKVVGICFGHQCVAEALGGRVERAKNGWGFGIRESIVVDEEARKYFPDSRLRLMYNHHDQVTALPRRASLIATSDFCKVESFRIGRHILTFQGHPEYVPEYEKHLLKNFSDGEPDDVKRRAAVSLDTMQHQGETVARWIVESFMKAV